MSWLFSRALVAEYSAATSSDGVASALSSGSHTPQAFLPPDKMTAFSRPSRFGMTFAPLTDALGGGLLTWFLAASPARTFPLLEQVTDWTGNDPASGLKWRGSLARFDPASHGWKTAQLSLLGDSDECLETWPRWGTTRDGESYLLPTLVRPTSASESGFWPTPNVPNGGRSFPADAEVRFNGKTPTAYHNGKKMQVVLEQAVRWWPTPVASMHKGSSPASLTRKTGASRENDRLDHAVMASNGGALNPTWVEWLMGWPLGWTDLKPLAMDKFLLWSRSHGERSQPDKEAA